jgi:fumarate reductase flavoprotein subunit
MNGYASSVRATRVALRRACRRAAFVLIAAIAVIFGIVASGRLVAAQPASSTDAKPAVPGGGHGFLIDTHLAHHIECAACHTENPQAKAVGTATCNGCHQEIAASKAPQPNPHHAHSGHLGDIPCASCHHVHQESVLVCNECHNFNMKTP